jgi:hypothetical protein
LADAHGDGCKEIGQHRLLTQIAAGGRYVATSFASTWRPTRFQFRPV